MGISLIVGLIHTLPSGSCREGDCRVVRWHLTCGAERCCWKDVHMPPPYPREFREDVVRVAQSREPGVRLADIAKDFAISESCLNNWLRDADVEAGVKPGATSDDRAENRELKRRLRLLEQENEVLRRAAAYLSQANLPKK